MMRELSRNFWIALVVLLGFVMLSACATVPKTTPGLYVNKDVRFSVKYPENWKPDKLQGTDEVLRVVNPTQWKLPVLTASIVDLAKGAKLKDSPKAWIASVKKSFPKTKRHKALSKEMIKLEGGTPASAYIVKWTWEDGVTKLQTAAVTAYKGKKAVTVSATTVFGGQTTPDKLLAMCKTLKFH